MKLLFRTVGEIHAVDSPHESVHAKDNSDHFDVNLECEKLVSHSIQHESSCTISSMRTESQKSEMGRHTLAICFVEAFTIGENSIAEQMEASALKIVIEPIHRFQSSHTTHR
jgi:lambda repressor-like predicted transcriptional regulator